VSVQKGFFGETTRAREITASHEARRCAGTPSRRANRRLGRIRLRSQVQTRDRDRYRGGLDLENEGSYAGDSFGCALYRFPFGQRIYATRDCHDAVLNVQAQLGVVKNGAIFEFRSNSLMDLRISGHESPWMKRRVSVYRAITPSLCSS
jgi:hypothetical protein